MRKLRSIISIVGFVLLVIAFVFAFSRQFFTSVFGVQSVAEVAEILGGLTAPVIGVVGAILIYISFREQVKANAIQFQTLTEQRDLELLYRFYEELKEDLQLMQGVYGPQYSQPAILDSFMNYIVDDRSKLSPYPEFQLYLFYLFNQFIFISNRVKRNKSLNASEKVYIIDKLNYLFDLYFRQYHTKLDGKEFSSNTSIDVKRKLFNLTDELHKLDMIRKRLKDDFRNQNLQN
jgi:hypothetical protein